mmetsp:Transcript_126480/g.219149  ORF Transcript_126480/g.219149 Transcript_126480/m.219149 type:complete len:210 (+) Transcript_126480:246-875(+)
MLVHTPVRFTKLVCVLSTPQHSDQNDPYVVGHVLHGGYPRHIPQLRMLGRSCGLQGYERVGNILPRMTFSGQDVDKSYKRLNGIQRWWGALPRKQKYPLGSKIEVRPPPVVRHDEDDAWVAGGMGGTYQLNLLHFLAATANSLEQRPIQLGPCSESHMNHACHSQQMCWIRKNPPGFHLTFQMPQRCSYTSQRRARKPEHKCISWVKHV